MLTATEAAALLSISKRTLYTLAAEKKIACYRFGSAVRFDPQDLDAYKAQCRSPATTPDAGSISLTVSSTASESALTSYFQRAGRASRRSHSTSAKRRGNWWRASRRITPELSRRAAGEPHVPSSHEARSAQMSC